MVSEQPQWHNLPKASLVATAARVKFNELHVPLAIVLSHLWLMNYKPEFQVFVVLHSYVSYFCWSLLGSSRKFVMVTECSSLSVLRMDSIVNWIILVSSSIS